VWHWQPCGSRVQWRPAGYGHECLKGQARIKRTPRAQACEGWMRRAGSKKERAATPGRRQDASRKSQSQCTHAASLHARPSVDEHARLGTAVMWGVASSLG
jgi:hypothetical protein